MPKEKAGYRDMLMFLSEDKKAPLLLNRGQACELMGISRDHLAEMIYKGEIKLSENKIPIGSIARYLCG